MTSVQKVVPTNTETTPETTTYRQKDAESGHESSSSGRKKGGAATDDDDAADGAAGGVDLANENEEPEIVYNYVGNKWEATLAGITIVLGGLSYGWTSSFSAGFGSYLTALIVVGVSYTILLASLGELTSCLAFPGGTYGLARVVLGFYPGFLIGYAELLEYVFMTTASVSYVGEMFVSFIGCDPKYTPAMWLIFYGFAGKGRARSRATCG